MKELKRDSVARRTLVLIKFDIDNLYSRIKDNFDEYIQIFSMKRTREHFNFIFKSKYDGIEIKELIVCSEDILISLNKFYTDVDKLYWYLISTEDLPAKVEDRVSTVIKELRPVYETVRLYIEAELNSLESDIYSS